ncbi:MATE family efflux transporter [uncultured Eubacterium sp.]|uniref:MATE family efflux transporter n=1 Tax=uncultured Eubacterium sp. TaxID=165185 RepID=UPI0025F21A5C|nr:MATE family efflux transporter [uncultured Eubacterium sp.]
MKQKNNMLSGNVLKSIIPFALPIMLSSLLQYNYSLIDNIIVGRYVSTDALAAVGNVGPISSFVVGASLGLTSGFTIPIAQAFGASDRKKLNLYTASSVKVSLIAGICTIIFGEILSYPLLRAIGTPDEIIKMSASYINVLYLGVPFQMLSSNFTAISRAVGESRKPLYFHIVSVIVNFFLDLLFVKHFAWGVEGAAGATLISQALAMVLTGAYVFKFNQNISVTKSDFKPNIKVAWEQIKLGIPVSLQFTITSIGSMCLQGAVNGFGANVIAGFTAAGKVENLTNIPMSGLGVATQTFVGQNYGAKNYDRIVKSIRKIFVLDLVVSVIMSITLYAIGEPLVSLFSTEVNSEMMFAAKRYILATAQCYSLVAILFVLRNSLQGLGYTYANMIAGAGELVGRIAIAFIFTKIIGFSAVCYAAPAAWLLADIPLAIIYLNKEKKFKRLAKQQSAVGKTQ